jgi:hypothetical protein
MTAAPEPAKCQCGEPWRVVALAGELALRCGGCGRMMRVRTGPGRTAPETWWAALMIPWPDPTYVVVAVGRYSAQVWGEAVGRYARGWSLYLAACDPPLVPAAK